MGVAAHANNASQKPATFAATVEAPAGFADLSEPRQVLADVYFGGDKIGEAPLTSRPGFVRFKDPEALLALIPSVAQPEDLLTSLRRELPSNPSLICSSTKSADCGTLKPELAGVIFNEEHFRLDLFISPYLLKPVSPVEQGYLKSPAMRPSLVSSVGLSLSGSSHGRTDYNLQNRTLLALGSARLRSDSSYSRSLGLLVDNFVAEVDRRDLRYSAGMFWAPGLDVIGQRRMIGAGFTTQLDTRSDKDLIEGNPLYLFLERAARVDVLVDGRLVDSRAYEAGNNLIDTTALPTGAYGLVLRVHEAGRRVRDERRFFARNARVAPVGKPIYFGFAGVLANSPKNRPFTPTDTFLYQLGTAHRINGSLALDASLIGTQRRSILEGGAYFLSRSTRVRAAALVSNRGDRGALLQIGSSGSGPLSLNLDLRRIYSRDRKPLIPLAINGEDFEFEAPMRAQFGAGSFTQFSGSAGYRIRRGYVGLTGSYSRDGADKSDYNLGPSLSMPLIQRNGLQLIFQADAQRSRRSSAAYAGLRLLTTSGGASLIGTAGYASLRSRSSGEPSRTRQVGSMAAEWYHQAADQTEISLGAGVERTVHDTSVRASVTAYTPMGTVRGDILHHFGAEAATQYGINLQAGLAMDRSNVAIGGRELQQSAIVASIDGDAGDAEFEVLIDGAIKGRLSSGGRLPIYLPPYRAYRVRLKPVAAASVTYDTRERAFTLFPGSVASMRWTVQQSFTVFGQALAPDGSPIADARIETRNGIGQTDALGYFQVDVANGEDIRLARAHDQACQVSLTDLQPKSGYAALGKVICK